MVAFACIGAEGEEITFESVLREQCERLVRRGLAEHIPEQKRFVIRLNMLPEFDAVRA